MLMTEGSLAKILGPWLLMGVGLILLAVLYLPVRKESAGGRAKNAKRI
jgi:hypothetical protein